MTDPNLQDLDRLVEELRQVRARAERRLEEAEAAYSKADADLMDAMLLRCECNSEK